VENKYTPGKYRNHVTLAIYYGVRVIVLVAFVGFLFLKVWDSAFYTLFIFFLIIAPSIIKERYKIFLPFELDLAVGTFVLLSLFFGEVRGFYDKFPYWDAILHFQSGILLGVVGFILIYILNEQKTEKLHLSPGFIAFFSVCFSLALSVLWEVFEFTADSFFGANMQESGLPDTMGDLIVNGIGAIVIASLGYVWMKRRLRLPFTPKQIKKY